MTRRIVFAFLLLFVARATLAQSVLLPVSERVAPWYVEQRCLGLRVYDLYSGAVLRSFPQFGCVESVASAGPARAWIVAHPADSTRTDARIVDVDDGRVLARLPLGEFEHYWRIWIRALDADDMLIGVEYGPTTQLRRVHVSASGALELRAAREAAGRFTLADRGDTIALWHGSDGAVDIERVRVDDLAPLGNVHLDLGTDVYTISVLEAGGRVHIWTWKYQRGYVVETVDAATGASLSSRATPFALGQFPFIDATHILAVRTAHDLPGDDTTSFHSEFVSVALADFAMTPVSARGEYVYATYLDAHGVAVAVPPVVCFTGLCGQDGPLEVAYISGGSTDRFGGEPITATPNSVQFVGPPLVAQGTAAPIPALDITGGLMLALSLLMLGTRSIRR